MGGLPCDVGALEVVKVIDRLGGWTEMLLAKCDVTYSNGCVIGHALRVRVVVMSAFIMTAVAFIWYLKRSRTNVSLELLGKSGKIEQIAWSHTRTILFSPPIERAEGTSRYAQKRVPYRMLLNVVVLNPQRLQTQFK